MKADYWNVSDEQVKEKTGKSLVHWMGVLRRLAPASEKPADLVRALVEKHDVPRYWARTLTTRFLKDRE